MLLKKVLQSHDTFSALTPLREVLGDGYLYANNPIHKNIRDVFTRLGYGFTPEDFCSYQTLRLAALPHILNKKLVPYQDTYTGLVNLERANPAFFKVEEIPVSVSNSLTHEASHCIADELLPRINARRGSPAYKRDFVFRSSLSEAFALATDAMVGAYADNEIHRYFYRRNSYQSEVAIEEMKTIVFKAISAFGFAGTYKTLMLSALLGQFLTHAIDKKTRSKVWNRIMPGRAVPKGRDGKLFDELLKSWLARTDANAVLFYVETASFFYKLNVGSAVNLEKLYQDDPLELLARHPEHWNALETLVSCAESGRLPGMVMSDSRNRIAG